MRLGIITFHNVYNYGAVLQAMALQQYLTNLGIGEVELINYHNKEFHKLYSLWPFFGGPKMCLQRLIRIKQRYTQAKVFDDFIKSNLHQSRRLDEDELIDYCGRFDVLIYGSDQIWNNNLTGDNGFYFGDFVPEGIVKVSYAASFGTDSCNEFQKRYIRKNLSKFSKLSVRELQAVEFINSEIDRNVSLVVDPVFLIDECFWDKWIRGINVVNKPYILYYSLQHNQRLSEATVSLANKMGLPVVCIHPTAQKQEIGERQLYNIGPREFVSLVKNAEIICTNSFHAMAFSCIFKKKVLHQSHTKSKGRVYNLLKLFNISDEQINGITDYSKLNYKQLENLIEESKAFLNSLLAE